MNFYQKGGSEYLFVCDLFKELRKKSNLSQADAANHIGVNQSFISKFENGHTGIDLFDALALLDLYGIDHVDFFYMLDQFKKRRLEKVLYSTTFYQEAKPNYSKSLSLD